MDNWARKITEDKKVLLVYALTTPFVQLASYIQKKYLLLRRTQGVWYITDVFAADPATAFEPVYVWKQLKRGASYFMIRVLACWRALVRKAVAWA